MRTLLALALLACAAPAQVGYRPPHFDPMFGFQDGYYGIVFWGGAAIVPWNGEMMVLLGSSPLSAHQERVPIVTLDGNGSVDLTWRVGIEVVGWAAYDPRPCAVGSRAVFSTPTDPYYAQVVGGTCGFRSTALIDPSGFAFSFQEKPYPVIGPDCGGASGISFANYYVSYCRESNPWGGCTSECHDASGPLMGFILGRLVIDP